MLNLFIDSVKSIIDLLKKGKESKKIDLEITKLQRELNSEKHIIQPTFDQIKEYDPNTRALIKKAKQEEDYCYVATYVYEDINHPNVVLLRKYRDTVLLQRKYAKHFVSFYYKIGPYFANNLIFRKIISIKIRLFLDIYCKRIKRKVHNQPFHSDGNSVALRSRR